MISGVQTGNGIQHNNNIRGIAHVHAYTIVKLCICINRTNIGPFMNNDKKEPLKIKEKEQNKESNEDSMKNENKLLKDELKRLTEKIRFIEDDYIKCENELKQKTEEVEKLRIQLKSQEKIIILNEKVEKTTDTTGSPQLYQGCNKSELLATSENHFKEHSRRKHTLDDSCTCDDCRLRGIKKSVPKEHIQSMHTGDKENSCYKCDYQGKDEGDLNYHLTHKHETEEEHNCSDCCFQGISRRELKKHFIMKHMINCTEFDFYCDNEKNFEAHKQLIHPKKNGIRCRICGEFFESK